jgi:DNA-binding MarR family transcriptional regulator
MKNQKAERDSARIATRQARENYNVFSRLPTVYAASRAPGQQLLAKGGGLSIVEWRTLWDLHEVGPMTIRDLANVQRADHSLISRALPEMKRKGYVTVRRDRGDGRATVVEIAPDGVAAYEQAAPIMARRRAALREVFSQDEIMTFVDMLDRLETFLRSPIDDLIEKDSAE